MYLVFLLLLFASASVAQPSTIITTIDELSFSFVKGAPAQSQNFLLVPNFRARLLFNLKWNTPGYSPSWIVFAGTEKGNGEGEFSNGNPVTVTVRVDSINLPIGTTIGYLYI